MASIAVPNFNPLQNLNDNDYIMLSQFDVEHQQHKSVRCLVSDLKEYLMAGNASSEISCDGSTSSAELPGDSDYVNFNSITAIELDGVVYPRGNNLFNLPIGSIAISQERRKIYTDQTSWDWQYYILIKNLGLAVHRIRLIGYTSQFGGDTNNQNPTVGVDELGNTILCLSASDETPHYEFEGELYNTRSVVISLLDEQQLSLEFIIVKLQSADDSGLITKTLAEWIDTYPNNFTEYEDGYWINCKDESNDLLWNYIFIESDTPFDAYMMDA